MTGYPPEDGFARRVVRGSHEFKGVPEPVTLFQLVRASGGGRRSEQRNLTPLVGRADEMATLLRRWDRARHGDGQLVMIVGEPSPLILM